MSQNNQIHSEFTAKTEELRKIIHDKADDIWECLKDYEAKDTVDDEIERSISALSGVEEELKSLINPDFDIVMSTFFPLNLPLYSLVLFAVIPSYYCKHVYIRVPAQMYDSLVALSEVIDIQRIFPKLHFLNVTRSVFTNIYVSQSHVVLFTGKHENAETVRQTCPEALFIYNGSGINPAIVFEDSDVALAAKKIFEMRTFNSGQDCAGTDAIFVHRNHKARFISELKNHIKEAKIGLYGDPATKIGPIMRDQYVEEIKKYLDHVADHIEHKGKIDHKSRLVTPYIIVRDAGFYGNDYHEFFAPVFNVLVFDTEQDLLPHLHHKRFLEYSMYLTYYGSSPNLSVLSPKTINLENMIINDIEQGNHPYGGYGERANYVAFGGNKAVRPQLISHEISNFFTTFNLNKDL